MRTHTTSRLSEHIELTPEGYLYCPDVAIARTGVMRYAPDEVPDDLAEHVTNGEVLVYRKAADVFSASTLASFEGKPVTIDHPDEWLAPDNWADLAVGHIQDVRRGDPGKGEADDLMIADLLITDADAIAMVKGGLRELSCGYDADYVEIAPGVGRQTNIIGNHVALVTAGRAGARCKILDRSGRVTNASGSESRTSAPLTQRSPRLATAVGQKEGNMQNTSKTGWWDRIMGNPKVRKAIRDAEAAAPQCDEEPAQAADEEAAPATDDDPIAASLEEIKLMLRTLVEALPKPSASAGDDPQGAGDEDPNATGDGDPDAPTSDEDIAADEDVPSSRPTGDSAMRRQTADADTVRRARLLAPGLRVRTGDNAAAVRRAALRTACRDVAVARTVDACLAGVPLDRARSGAVAAAFIAASEVAAGRNNRQTADVLTRAQGRDNTAPMSPADINKLNADFYGRK